MFYAVIQTKPRAFTDDAFDDGAWRGSDGTTRKFIRRKSSHTNSAKEAQQNVTLTNGMTLIAIINGKRHLYHLTSIRINILVLRPRSELLQLRNLVHRKGV